MIHLKGSMLLVCHTMLVVCLTMQVKTNATKFKLCHSYGNCKIDYGTWDKMIICVYIVSLLCPTIDVDPKWKDFKVTNGPILTIDDNEC